MKIPRFEFCDDLDAPEICVILDMQWWGDHRQKIIQWLEENQSKDCYITSNMLFINNAALRTAFILKWNN